MASTCTCTACGLSLSSNCLLSPSCRLQFQGSLRSQRFDRLEPETRLVAGSVSEALQEALAVEAVPSHALAAGKSAYHLAQAILEEEHHSQIQSCPCHFSSKGSMAAAQSPLGSPAPYHPWR